MKFLVAFLLLVAMTMVAVEAQFGPPPRRPPHQPRFPFPGYGTFNPKRRFRRSPQDKNNQISISGQKGGGGSQWNAEAQHKVWENKHGSIHVSGGANKQPGGKPQGQVGVGGSFHWG